MRMSKKILITLVCVLTVVSVAAGASLAYIFAKTPELENTFQPIWVSCRVEENFDGVIKSDVAIRNTGDINAYIRATVVIMWTSDSGSVHALTPQKDIDYTVTGGSNKWVLGSDGFYYYIAPVSPEEVTDLLIGAISPLGTPPEGYTLTVHIAATAIQSDPPRAIEEAWGATVTNTGTLTPP